TRGGGGGGGGGVFGTPAGARMAGRRARPTPRGAPPPAGRSQRVGGAQKQAPPAAVPRVELAAVPPVVGPMPEPGTPSFLGLSLREALTRAHADGWTVDGRGTGWVPGQSPPPGAPLGDHRLALALRPDQPARRP